MILNKHFYRTAGALLAVSLLSTACGQKDAAEGTAKAILLPDAEVVGYVGINALISSPIYQYFDEKQGEDAEEEEMEKVDLLVKEHLGLEDADWVDGAFSLQGLATAEENPESLRMTAGLLVSKEVTLEQIQALIAAMDEEDLLDMDFDPAELKTQTVAGTEALVIPAKPGESPEAYAAPVPFGSGTMMVISTKGEFATAVEKAKAGQAQDLAEGVQPGISSLKDMPDVWLVASLPAEKMQELSQGMQENPMMAAIAPAVATMKNLSVGINFGDTLGVQIVGLVADEAGAQQVSQTINMLFQMMVKPMVMQGMGLQPGQPGPGVLENLEIASEAEAFFLRTSLSVEDIEMMEKMQEEQAAAQGMNTMPPAPAPAP